LRDNKRRFFHRIVKENSCLACDDIYHLEKYLNLRER
jgi:hypothetical protein